MEAGKKRRQWKEMNKVFKKTIRRQIKKYRKEKGEGNKLKALQITCFIQIVVLQG